MKTSFSGKRDKRGDWDPGIVIQYAPVLAWPLKPLAILKWLFGYPGFFLPWGIIYMAVPAITWLWFTPALDSMRTFQPVWIAYIVLRNLILLLVVIGAWHAWLYVVKVQGTDFKYTTKWPARDNPNFLFKNQVYENLFYSVFSAVPIWSAYEVVTLWGYANGYFPYVSWHSHPIYCAVLMCLVPLIRDLHFYTMHRISHWGPLYRWVHSVHHNNVDVNPLSGVSMHPIEHVLYWSGVLIHWVIPSHPIHALFHMQHAAITPAQSHAGFATVVLHEGVEVKTHDFFHYLHHKYFECNYGADGVFPLDKWFGTFNDGTAASTEAMQQRFLARAHRQQGKGEAS